MNNKKFENSNISLLNLADIKNIGLFLSAKKGINEILHKRHIKKNIKEFAEKNDYEDLLSVVICTIHPSESLLNAVNSLLNQNFNPKNYEIIVVNNSDTDFPDKFLPEGVKLIKETVKGLSRARNTGAAAAKGEYILYIDDDTEANNNLLYSIYTAYKNNPDFSIIGGQIILNVPSPVPEVFLKGREAIWSGYTVPYKEFREVKNQYAFPYGACFSIKHSVLDALGGFSLDYGRCGNDYKGGEETELCFKAQKYGLKIGIEPGAEVLHCVSRERFSKEHIKQTVFEGITTTYRLYKDGYTPYKWTKSYINERIKILNKEILKLKTARKNLDVFYKECELNAFLSIREDAESSNHNLRETSGKFLKSKKELHRKHPIRSTDIKGNFKRGLVSVVLPVYNCEEYLEESIKSVLSQTYTNFELIIVDDGSTDFSGEIADLYAEKDERVKVIHQENKKLPNALNMGFSLSSGEFRTWTSADNRMLPICLEILVSEIVHDKSCDMVFANMRLIDKNGNSLKGYGWYEKPPFSGNVILPDNTSELNVHANNTIGAAFLYRSGTDKILNGYSEKYFTLEDYEYFMRMNFFFSIKHTLYKKPVYEYRIHKNSLTAHDKELGITSSRPLLMKSDARGRAESLGTLYFFADGNNENISKILNTQMCQIHCKSTAERIIERGKSHIIYVNYGNVKPTLSFPDNVTKFLITDKPLTNTENTIEYDSKIFLDTLLDASLSPKDWISVSGGTSLASYVFLRAKSDNYHKE